MVRSRVNSSTSRWADEHILVIGILPFTPQKDGTSGPSSWKPVKDLVRFCLAQGSGDDPKVEIIDYCSDKFQPQAFVKLKKEENAKCVFERLAGNFWYGNVLQVWWLISPTQPGANRPAQVLRYSSRREYPESLEKHAQIRDDKLVQRGSFPQNNLVSSPSWSSTRNNNTRARRTTQSRNSRDFHIPSRPGSSHHQSPLQNSGWTGQAGNPFPYFSQMGNSLYMDPYLSNLPSDANHQQWPMANSMSPQIMPGQDHAMLNNQAAAIHQWVALNPGLSPASSYEIPVSMAMPLPMSAMGMTPVYPTAVPYMVSPMVMQDAYMSGYGGYIPPSSAEYSYPNQKPTQPDNTGITAALADLSVSNGGSSISSSTNNSDNRSNSSSKRTDSSADAPGIDQDKAEAREPGM